MMRIDIPNKRFFTVLLFAFTLLLLGGAFALYDPTKGSHDTLWTDRIEPKTTDRIIVTGNLEVTGNLIASTQGVTPQSGAVPRGTICGRYVYMRGNINVNIACLGVEVASGPSNYGAPGACPTGYTNYYNPIPDSKGTSWERFCAKD
jgi:hypothetical protein